MQTHSHNTETKVWTTIKGYRKSNRKIMKRNTKEELIFRNNVYQDATIFCSTEKWVFGKNFLS